MLVKLARTLLAIYCFVSIGFAFYANSTDDNGTQMLAIALVLAPMAALFVGVFLIALLKALSKKSLIRDKLNTIRPGLGDGESGKELVNELVGLRKQAKADRPEKANAIVAAAVQKQLSPVRSDEPDEVYWAEAYMAGIETGDEFKTWVETCQASSRLPKPSDIQRDRIAAQFDADNKKRDEFIRTPPIAVIRKPRATQDVTTGGPSWFGGKPTLGDRPWPLTTDGTPMHHRATLDLAELKAYPTPPGLPDHGKLAFFAHAGDRPYEGKVIYVSDATTTTMPPDNLPVIFHNSEFMYDHSDDTQLDAPTEYLHWTVEFIDLPMNVGQGWKLAQEVMTAIFPDTTNMNLHTKAYVETFPDMTRPLLWDSAKRYARKTTLAEVHLDKTMQHAQKAADNGDARAAEKLTYLQLNTLELRKFIDDVNNWVKPHDRWDPMTDNDRAAFEAFLARVTPDKDNPIGLGLYYPFATVGRNINNINEECDATFRAVARGPENLYKRLPQVIKDALDKTHRLPGSSQWHQMFGQGVSVQVAGEEHPHDHLLLQLHSDHMMNGVWANYIVIQFWISSEDLFNQDWDKVVVTMESD